MASRLQQKQQARAARLEHERIERERKLTRRRSRMAAALILLAAVVVGSVIAISGAGGGTSARAAATRVQSLLAGLPQSRGNVLGRADAPVTVTEFSDLQCSACDAFDLASGVTSPAGIPGNGILEALIRDEVATGKAKLVYRSLETATANGATPGMWTTQQAAVNAAGLQGKAWNFVELFYNEQGPEGTPYVTMHYLEGLARQIPGLDYASWLRSLSSDRRLAAQVARDNAEGTRLDGGRAATPTIWVKGPKHEATFQGITQSPLGQIATIERAIEAAA